MCVYKDHNKKILEKLDNDNQASLRESCNCSTKPACLLNGDCLSLSTVYNAKILTKGNELN